jgi:hypothetical protein
VGSMRKLLAVVVALACALALSSCELAPFGLGLSSDNRRGNARMGQIAAAVNSHDAAALKALFSPLALKNAPTIDDDLADFLSSFPDGGLTWKREVVSPEGRFSPGETTELLKGYYTVSAGGKAYELFFADFTINEYFDPGNVGIYGLGIMPLTEDREVGPAESFYHWTGAIQPDLSNADGYPGVYVGYDNTSMSRDTMTRIVEELNSGDTVGLKHRFSEYAQSERAAGLDSEVDALFALFPDANVVWDDPDAVPVPHEKTENGQKTLLLLTTYRVSASGKDYWLLYADFRENPVDPTNLGIYAIGVAPRTTSEDSPAEKALFAWADAFDVDANVPPGIFISQ